MPLPFPFDFKNPDYLKVFEWRQHMLNTIRGEAFRDPAYLPTLKDFYRTNPAQFIIDWGVTFDPRNVVKGQPALVPFLLFPKQEEWVHWFMDLWKRGRPGLTVKSREIGMSELMCALAATHCMLMPGLILGFGSRKEAYVDAIGKPNSLLFKVRRFVEYTPVEFRGQWDRRRDSSLLRINFPETGSMITGEAGDNIGRGDRTSYYNVDESAWLARPDLIEASLSQTTTFRHDVSTPHGPNNPFARKVVAGNVSVFRFHWTDDLRKDEAWYKQQCEDIDDPVIIAQELDLDFTASIEGVVIPAVWVEACIDAHIKLRLRIEGDRRGALDVADEGRDKNALVGGLGVVIDYLNEWTGKGSDIYATTEEAATQADLMGYDKVIYDADGLGAGVRGDARKVNEERKKNGVRPIKFLPFRGSGAVVDKDKEVFPARRGEPTDRAASRTNGDYYGNAKAQGWMDLRQRVRNTYHAVVEGREYNPHELICISSAASGYLKLARELSQPTRRQGEDGKIYIDKQPDGMPSPNYGDACMMYFAKTTKRARGYFDVD